jgi:hypothetical protein
MHEKTIEQLNGIRNSLRSIQEPRSVQLLAATHTLESVSDLLAADDKGREIAAKAQAEADAKRLEEARKLVAEADAAKKPKPAAEAK